MPTSVLSIPVDTAEFKDFLSLFDKYQKNLKAQPDAWKDVNSSINNVVGATREFIDELEDELDMLELISVTEGKLESVRSGAAQRKKKERDEDAKAATDEANKRKTAVDHAREYARNVDKAVKSVSSLAGDAASGITGGGAGLFGAAGSLLSKIPFIGGIAAAGVGALYEGASKLQGDYRGAHSVGVSTQALQAWHNTIGNYLPEGAADSLLSNVANAQFDPSQWGKLSRAGVKNFQTRDVGDVSEEVLMNAQKFMKTHTGAAGNIAGANRFGGVVDPATLRMLRDMSPGDLKQHFADLKKATQENASADKSALDATKMLSKAEQLATSALDTGAEKIDEAASQLAEGFKQLYLRIAPFLNAAKNWSDFKASDMLKLHRDKVNPYVDKDPKHDVWNVGGGLSNLGHAAVAGYDSIVGHVMSIAGGVSHLTLGALAGYNAQIRAGARARGLGNSSAIGQYQIVGDTRERVGKALYGDKWKSMTFDAAHQEEMAKYIWEHDARYKDAHAVFASLPDSRRGAYGGYSWEQIRGRLARGEGGIAHDSSHVHHAIAAAVKKGVVDAHRAHPQTLVVKTQHKPGSDVTTSAKQLAGK